MIAPTAIKVINAKRRGPTFSPKTIQPIKAANTVEVSRNTAASPTLSNRVANMMQPNEKYATMPPVNPRSAKGPSAGFSTI